MSPLLTSCLSIISCLSDERRQTWLAVLTQTERQGPVCFGP